jgi:hypothetical protein
MEQHSWTDRKTITFCRIVFSQTWRSFEPGDHFDTNNADDVSVTPTASDMFFIQNLGYIPRSVVEEVQVVEKTITTVTSERVEVVDTMSFTC